MMNKTWLRRVASAATVTVLAGVFGIVAQSTPASAAFVTPKYLRSIGGDGRPGVFAWGTQWNPVTNEILVGDYLNYEIRRYDINGNYLGEFWRPNAAGQPYSIGVDPRDGAIYVSEVADGGTPTIAKYDKDGNFLYSWVQSGPGQQYQVWMTIDNDGNMWILDSHYWNTLDSPPRVVEYTTDDTTKKATRVKDFPVIPPDVTTDDTVPRMYGIDVDNANGTLFLSDAFNGRIYRYSEDGTWLNTFGQAESGNDERGVALNETRQLVYVVDAQHSDVDVFDYDGNYQFSFGSEGTGPGQFTGGGRQVTVDGDGNVWVADFGGFQEHKYTWDGQWILTTPNPSMKPPVGFLAQPRDVSVDQQSGEVWVADSWAQRIQRFSPTGASMGAFGHRGEGGPLEFNYPRSIGVNPFNRQIWVANERGHNVQVYNYPVNATAAPTYVTQIGDVNADDTDPGHFRWPLDFEFYQRPDGTDVAVIGDRSAASVKIFDATTYQELLMIPVSNNGTAVDPATGNIYILNSSRTRIDVYDQSGNSLFNFGTRGNGDGQFSDFGDAVFANGLLYVSDENLSRIQVFNPDGTYVGKIGAAYGEGAFDFRNPVGLSADAQGRLYVADTVNDRIQVFDPSQTGTVETTPPSVPAFTAPANQAVLPLNGVTISGTATDNTSVSSVELNIQDLATGLWWDSSNATWSSTPVDILSAWTSNNAPATSISWKYIFQGVKAGGTYLVQARTRDASGELSQYSNRTFGMPGTTPPPPPPPPATDTTRPNVTVTYPVKNAQLPFTAVNVTGTATDNVGVSQVLVSIKNTANNQWWNGGTGRTGFSSTYRQFTATLDNPEGTSTNWSYPFAVKAAGTYQVLVQTFDDAGNKDNTPPNVSFVVTTNPPDTTAPETTLTSPLDGASLSTSPTPITGTATDDSGVGQVKLSIFDTLSSMYWNGTTWSSTATTVNATLATPNATATNYSYTFNPGASAASTYQVTATAVDTSSNADQTPAAATFTRAGAPDTQAPVTTVSSPPNNGSVSAPVTVSGTSTDNVGVTQVRVSIRDNSTNLWWNGTSWGAFTYLTATLDTPGATTTGWSYTFNAPATGNYGVQVRSADGAGNLGAYATWRNFKVV